MQAAPQRDGERVALRACAVRPFERQTSAIAFRPCQTAAWACSPYTRAADVRRVPLAPEQPAVAAADLPPEPLDDPVQHRRRLVEVRAVAGEAE